MLCPTLFVSVCYVVSCVYVVPSVVPSPSPCVPVSPFPKCFASSPLTLLISHYFNYLYECFTCILRMRFWYFFTDMIIFFLFFNFDFYFLFLLKFITIKKNILYCNNIIINIYFINDMIFFLRFLYDFFILFK